MPRNNFTSIARLCLILSDMEHFAYQLPVTNLESDYELIAKRQPLRGVFAAGLVDASCGGYAGLLLEALCGQFAAQPFFKGMYLIP